jgi:DNA-binding winged helix-turn-helix (wHTH) protein/predicted ATPase
VTVEVGPELPKTSDPFRLDLANECLWRGPQLIRLRPKAFALLNLLAGHPGRLVTKEELLSAVWPDTFVTEAVLKVAIGQLREAFHDDPRTPRFIETAHRRGYRFIGQIVEGGLVLGKDQEIGNYQTRVNLPVKPRYQNPGVVGRDAALSKLRSWLETMLTGKRQIVFVTGEAGIGKTVLVDTFSQSLDPSLKIRVCRGQSLEQYGTCEAYLPVLEAVGQLCRDHEEVVDFLRAHAPMWLLQLPSLVSTKDRELLSREVLGATRERMLREICDALEALAVDTPLLLILEDLHWSDYSTLDLISYVARQRQEARLMLIGTYRTAELIASRHPLKGVKQELVAKQQCEELPLEYLSRKEVYGYLNIRFKDNRFPPALAGLIRERTEGNPLFMVNAVDYLISEGLVVKRNGAWELERKMGRVELGVPDSIKQMINKQLEYLEAEQRRTLEAASVAGSEFSTLALVAGLDEDRNAVEARCEELARRRQFIQECGVQELPNGETVTRYGFIHALYQNALYERVPSHRRIQLHRRIAEKGEAVYAARSWQIAAELAMHYERGVRYERAVKYLQLAADNAVRRFAYRDAVVLSRRGLELLEKLPDTPDRARQELSLQLTLGVPLIATEGYASPDVGSVYARARELCQQLGETPEISQVLWGLWTFHTLRADLGIARGIAEEFLRLAERHPYPGLSMRGHWAMEITFMHLGQFLPGFEHFEKALSLYDHERHRDDAFRYAQNPGVAMRCFAAWLLWFMGRLDQSLSRMREALGMARELLEPHGLAHALFFASVLHQFRGEADLALEHADQAIAVSIEHELVLYQAMARVIRGWALFSQGRREEGLNEMGEGLAVHRAIGTEVLCPHFMGLLAEALSQAGQIEKGIELVEEALALADGKGEKYYQAELWRIRGELLLMQAERGGSLLRVDGTRTSTSARRQPDFSEAENQMEQAIAISRQQGAMSWGLRAATSLARVYRDGGKEVKARDLLTQVYDTFVDGFDTADLRAAKDLLGELS